MAENEPQQPSEALVSSFGRPTYPLLDIHLAILPMMAQGMEAKQIAEALIYSTDWINKTIDGIPKIRRRRGFDGLYDRLGVPHTKNAACIEAWRRNLIPKDETYLSAITEALTLRQIEILELMESRSGDKIEDIARLAGIEKQSLINHLVDIRTIVGTDTIIQTLLTYMLAKEKGIQVARPDLLALAQRYATAQEVEQIISGNRLCIVFYQARTLIDVTLQDVEGPHDIDILFLEGRDAFPTNPLSNPDVYNVLHKSMRKKRSGETIIKYVVFDSERTDLIDEQKAVLRRLVEVHQLSLDPTILTQIQE